eukprot:5570997-Amphidinium_carterae.1
MQFADKIVAGLSDDTDHVPIAWQIEPLQLLPPGAELNQITLNWSFWVPLSLDPTCEVSHHHAISQRRSRAFEFLSERHVLSTMRGPAYRAD